MSVDEGEAVVVEFKGLLEVTELIEATPRGDACPEVVAADTDVVKILALACSEAISESDVKRERLRKMERTRLVLRVNKADT